MKGPNDATKYTVNAAAAAVLNQVAQNAITSATPAVQSRIDFLRPLILSRHSRIRFFLEYLILIAVMFTIITLPLEMAFGLHYAIDYLDNTCDFVFILNIIVSFFVAIEGMHVVSFLKNHKYCIRNQLINAQSKFVIISLYQLTVSRRKTQCCAYLHIITLTFCKICLRQVRGHYLLIYWV